MASDRRKSSLNRLSALLLPSSVSKHNSPTSASPIVKLTKFGRKDMASDSPSSAAWPLSNSIPEIPQSEEVVAAGQQNGHGGRNGSVSGPASRISTLSRPNSNEAAEGSNVRRGSASTGHHYHHHASEPIILLPQQRPQQGRQRSASSSFLQHPYQPEQQTVVNQLSPHYQAGTESSAARRLTTRKSEAALHQHSKNQSHNQALPSRDSLRSASSSVLTKPKIMGNAQSRQPSSEDGSIRQKRKSFFFGGGGRSSRAPSPAPRAQPSAWTIGPNSREYDPLLLSRGEREADLWDESGDVLIHLLPPGASRGPTFRISSQVLASSKNLISLVHGQVYSSRHSRQSRRSTGGSDRARSGSRTGSMYVDQRTQQLQMSGSNPSSPSIGPSPNQSHSDGTDDNLESRGLVEYRRRTTEIHLILNALSPAGAAGMPTAEDLDILVNARNFIAFLLFKPLVATTRRPTAVHVFHSISQLLREYDFSNLDNNNFGEIPEANFAQYVEMLHLADVRNSREKTVEAIWLALDMKSSTLWKEAFVHAAGKLDQIRTLKAPEYMYEKAFSNFVRNRLEKSNMELENRMKRITEELTNFEFPYIFSQVMNSRVADESKIVRFEQWKTAFNKMRTFTLHYVKDRFGAWPPKAKAKKGEAPVAGGLNRLVLRQLYNDLILLYDLLVDRNQLSSRLNAQVIHPDKRIEVLRKVLGEYDTSGSPVYPPVPFDAPLLPRLNIHSKDDGSDSDTKASSKKIPKQQISTVLRNSYNQDTLMTHNKTKIVESFVSQEARIAGSMTMSQLANHRLGSWLFLYAVLQALPLVTVDVPDVKYTGGVDYFLCMPPRGRLPWSKEREQTQLFRNNVTGAVIEAAKDTVAYSTDGIYKMSHCWIAGLEWEAALPPLALTTIAQSAPVEPQPMLPPPQAQEPFYGYQFGGPPAPSDFGGSGYVMSPQQYYPPNPVVNDQLPPPFVAPPPLPYAQELPGSASPVELESPYTNSPSPASLAPFAHSRYSASTPNLSQLAQLGDAPLPRPRFPNAAGNRGSNRQSMVVTLEMLPAPVSSASGTRNVSGTMTFDQILGNNTNGHSSSNLNPQARR